MSRRKRNPRGNLERAERKVWQFRKNEWYGMLTPCEALAILDDGAKEHSSVMYQREYLQKKVDAGQSGQYCFYFYPSGDQVQRWS